MADTGLSRALFSEGYIPKSTDEQQHLFTLFSVGGIVVITLIALFWLRSLARGRRQGPEARIYTP
ncbi:hypothetical protein [Streptomyces sp. NPDC055749]